MPWLEVAGAGLGLLGRLALRRPLGPETKVLLFDDMLIVFWCEM